MLVLSAVEHNYLVVDVCCLLHKYQLHVSALMTIFRLNELTKNIGSYIWHASYIRWSGGVLGRGTTFLLTPWSRDLFEKLNGVQLVKKFPGFYGNRRFITAFTSVRHLSLSSASLIQSIPPRLTNSLAAADTESASYRLLPLQVPKLMSPFRCLRRTRALFQVRGFICEYFVTG